MKLQTIFIWVLRLLAAGILLQTLFFKFSAHPQSVAIFTALELEPYGRISIGVLELVAALLILVPRTTGLGAFLAIGLMSGAVFFHLTKLGIVVDGDAILFIYALITLLASMLLTWIFRAQLFEILQRIRGLILKDN